MLEIGHMRTGSEIITRMFLDYGVSHVFYVEAVLRKSMVEFEKAGIHRILAHSEKGAAYMADGYARASRKVGVCMAQSVGAANLAAGLQDAYLSHSPVLAVTGRKPSHELNRNTYQEINHWPMYEPVTKYNVSVETTDELPQALRQAFREAVTGAPGPVHLDLPNHQAGLVESGKTAQAVVSEKRFRQMPAFRPYPDPEDVAEVIKQIYEADRPLLVFGGGAVISGAHQESLSLIDTLKVPFVTTVDGKGLIPENHPLCLGPVGRYGRKCANSLAAEADLVVYIGSGVSDQVTNEWTLPDPSVKVIQIDIDGRELGRNYPNSASILGDAKITLTQMLKSLKGAHANSAWSQKAAASVTAWRKGQEQIRSSSASPIRGERLAAEVQRALPANGCLVVDTGFSAVWGASIIELTQPGQRFFRPGGGSLGWGFPAALGVKCALPDQPVVCFTGDGAFWYHLAEMETAVRRNINTVTVLNNNQALGQSYRGIKMAYGDTPGRPEDQFAFSSVNLAKVASEMGALAWRVEKAEDIGPAIQKALASNKPAVVEVMTDILSDPQEY